MFNIKYKSYNNLLLKFITSDDASMFRVAAGKEKLLYDSYEEHEEQQFEVERIHYDREYKGSSEHFLADIVIVVLKTSIEFKSHIKPICLPFGKRWFNELTNYPTAKGKKLIYF